MKENFASLAIDGWTSSSLVRFRSIQNLHFWQIWQQISPTWCRIGYPAECKSFILLYLCWQLCRSKIRENPTSMLHSRTVACWKRQSAWYMTPMFWNGFPAITSLFFVVDRIAFLESVNFSMCDYMQNFQFSWWSRDHFLAPLGAYICQMPGHRLSILAKGTPSVLLFG